MKEITVVASLPTAEEAAPAGWEMSDDGKYWIRPDGTRQKVGSTVDDRKAAKQRKETHKQERRADALLKKSLTGRDKRSLRHLERRYAETNDEKYARRMDYIKKGAMSRGLAKQHLSRKDYKRFLRLERLTRRGSSEAQEKLQTLIDSIQDKKPKTVLQRLLGLFSGGKK